MARAKGVTQAVQVKSASEAELKAANEESVRFIVDLRTRYLSNAKPVVLNAVAGPRGDAYRPEILITEEAAEQYFGQQLSWLAATEVDMVTATTFNQSGEAAGLVKAARRFSLPAVVSFTVEINGTLATGQSLAEAIAAVDEATDGYPAYSLWMIASCVRTNNQVHCSQILSLSGKRLETAKGRPS